MDSKTIILYLEKCLNESTPEVCTLVKLKDGISNLVRLYRISEAVEKKKEEV